ncbi:MAG: hypothetical protein HZC36_11975 [Armatimonadetes bacterium]|nr:hypothetical protein [Armatimonadota bacterium]
MLNRVSWIGLAIMAVAVLLYLGDIVTTYVRPMLPWIAAVGGVLFVGGVAYAIVHHWQDGQEEPLSPEGP